jgi:hypothetical protein
MGEFIGINGIRLKCTFVFLKDLPVPFGYVRILLFVKNNNTLWKEIVLFLVVFVLKRN